MIKFVLTNWLLSCLVFTITSFFLLISATFASDENEVPISAADRTSAAYQRSYPRIKTSLELKKLRFGSPVFIRIFKQSKELEVWMGNADNTFVLYKTFIICHHSGTIGPKLEEGDRQSPEGFYRVGASQMNALSEYHLAFNLGYPNRFDRAHERTGGALMVHGRCSSIGCFAMTDYYMDEIYTLADRALASGQQEFQVHIFPFRLTPENLAAQNHSAWLSYWLNLKEGYDYFESYRQPPVVDVQSKRYVFSSPSQKHLAYRNKPFPDKELFLPQPSAETLQ